MEIFTITLDDVWQASFTQNFSAMRCCLGACVGAAGVWLLSPNPHKPHLEQNDTTHQAHTTQYKHTSRYLWSGIGAFICAIIGSSGDSTLLPWLLGIVILSLSLCVWDIYYYAVPNWQNLALLLISASKSIILAHILQNNFFIDISTIYDLLLGAGLISLVYILGIMFLQKQLLGEGDIIFCASFSALFGFETTVISIFWGCVLASIVSIFSRIFTKHTNIVIPLIPYIIGGLGVGVLWGLWL